MGYIKQGNNMILWGSVGKNIHYRDFPSGKAVTNFSVLYDFEPGDGQGRKKGKYLDVDTWKRDENRDLALYCSGLEHGDVVVCFGKLEIDEYQSKKKGADVFALNAESVHVQQYADSGEYTGDDEEEEEAPPPPPKREKAPRKPKESDYGEVGEYEDPGMVELPDSDYPDFLR